MRMKAGILAAFFITGIFPGTAGAVQKSDFVLKTTRDLVDLCATPKSDSLWAEAIHFCEGFLVGAVFYHDALIDRNEEMKRLICYPKGTTRDQGVVAFLDWASAHKGDTKLMNEPPVIGLVRSLSAKWPCK